MKISEMIISAAIKKGILYEARNVDTEIDIPVTIEGQEKSVKIHFKAEHMTLRIERE